jgi:hypothetical protein
VGLILLTAAELGEQSDFLLNTDWLANATKKRLDPNTNDLTLVLTFALAIQNPPIGGTPLNTPLECRFPYCRNPDAVLRRISQVT